MKPLKVFTLIFFNKYKFRILQKKETPWSEFFFILKTGILERTGSDIKTIRGKHSPIDLHWKVIWIGSALIASIYQSFSLFRSKFEFSSFSNLEWELGAFRGKKHSKTVSTPCCVFRVDIYIYISGKMDCYSKYNRSSFQPSLPAAAVAE